MNLLSKNQKVFPQLSFQLLWYMMLQEVLKNGPGLGFVLVFKAQIIVQDPVTFLSARSDCGLLQSQGSTTTHFHRVQCSKMSFQLVARAQFVTSHGSAVAGLHNCIMQSRKCWMLELWPSWGTYLLLFRPSRDESGRPGVVSHIWN